MRIYIKLKILFSLALLFCLCGCLHADVEANGACATNATNTVTNATKQVEHVVTAMWRDDQTYVYSNATAVLKVTFLNIGTRSEGQHGELFLEGKLMDAVKKGSSRMTPLGLLKYYGDERKAPWDVTGWHFADRRKTKRSSQLPPRKTE